VTRSAITPTLVDHAIKAAKIHGASEVIVCGGENPKIIIRFANALAESAANPSDTNPWDVVLTDANKERSS
jgi:hypothetical protein